MSKKESNKLYQKSPAYMAHMQRTHAESTAENTQRTQSNKSNYQVSYDPRSHERNLCNYVYRSLKDSGLQRDLNP